MTEVPRELWPIVCRLATSREWPPQGDADIAAFFNYAHRQKLLSLLIADDDLPQPVIAAKARFRALDALYRKRYELNRDSSLQLLRILGPDGFLFYKGSDYRHRLYDRPEQRPMTDLDVYIPWARLPAAMQKLGAAGYPRKYTYFAAFSPQHYELSVVIGGVLIELHRGFSQPIRAAVDYAGIWRRREWFERDGVGGYRLSPADAILAHAFHLAKDEFSSDFIRYLDFHLLLRQHQGDLETCVERAKAWQIERPLFGALHLTTTMFPELKTPAVVQAMKMLLDQPTRQFLVDHILPDLTTEPGQKQSEYQDALAERQAGTIGVQEPSSGWISGRRIQLRRKFALIDRPWRRGAFMAYYIYATAVGRVFEWRARRSGLKIPPRSVTRLR